ncbi:hypothetical protein AJ88_23700 [Mesorhizobium amorphae CCBAU 01583]|nr:hypothetical protein AJ88_23700 [Mesorhizobium amorphae CCBAU 01583]
MTDIEILASDAANVEIGRAKLKPVAPFDYCFVGSQPPQVVSSRPIDGEEGSSGMAKIAVKSLGPMSLDDAAIISFNRIDIDDSSPDLGFGLRVQSEDDTPFRVEPGSYNVQVHTPDGATFSNVIRAEPDSITEVTVDKGRSEQEWLAAATTAGLVESRSSSAAPIDDAEPGVRPVNPGELGTLTGWPNVAQATSFDIQRQYYSQPRYRGYEYLAVVGVI